MKLTAKWNGLPVWAWVVIGGTSAAGLYVFVRNYRKASSSSSASTPTTMAVTPSSPFGGGGGSFLPPATGGTPIPPVAPPSPGATGSSSPPPATGGTPIPPVIGAGNGGYTYTTQDVRDLFARYGIIGDQNIAAATFSPSSETAQQRLERIVRELNSGTVSIAGVTKSISMLPGSSASTIPAKAPAAAPSTPVSGNNVAGNTTVPTPIRPAGWPTTWPTVLEDASKWTPQQNAAWANPFSTIGAPAGTGVTPGTTRYGY